MIGAQYFTHNLFSLLWIIDLVETLIIDIVIGLNHGTRRQVWIRQLRINKFFNRNPWQLLRHFSISHSWILVLIFALFSAGLVLDLILLDDELIREVALVESLW